MTPERYLRSSDTYSQVDHRLLDAVSYVMKRTHRQDRLLCVAQYPMVYATLDRLIPKRKVRKRQGRVCRPHEWITTWSELERRASWQSSTTALRSCVDFAWRHYMVLPVGDDQSEGPSAIRILRLDHARQGLLIPLKNLPDDHVRNAALLHARATLAAVRALLDSDPRSQEDLERLSSLVDRLYIRYRHYRGGAASTMSATSVPPEIRRLEKVDLDALTDPYGRIFRLTLEDVVRPPRRVRKKARGEELWRQLDDRRSRRWDVLRVQLAHVLDA